MSFKRRNIYIAFLFWVTIITLIEICAAYIPLLHFGKDHGLVFRVIAFTLATSLYFLIINDYIHKFKTIIIGIIVGFMSYVIIYIIYMIASIIYNHDNSGFDIPLVFDLIFTALIVIIFGFAKYSKI